MKKVNKKTVKKVKPKQKVMVKKTVGKVKPKKPVVKKKAPPEKHKIEDHAHEQGEVNKSLIIAVITILALGVLVVLLLFSDQLVGKAFTPVTLDSAGIETATFPLSDSIAVPVKANIGDKNSITIGFKLRLPTGVTCADLHDTPVVRDLPWDQTNPAIDPIVYETSTCTAGLITYEVATLDTEAGLGKNSDGDFTIARVLFRNTVGARDIELTFEEFNIIDLATVNPITLTVTPTTITIQGCSSASLPLCLQEAPCLTAGGVWSSGVCDECSTDAQCAADDGNRVCNEEAKICEYQEICDDLIDNDKDSDVDCDDSDCTSVCGGETDCTDDVDNDGNGDTDCDDASCIADPACQVTDTEFTTTITAGLAPITEANVYTILIGVRGDQSNVILLSKWEKVTIAASQSLALTTEYNIPNVVRKKKILIQDKPADQGRTVFGEMNVDYTYAGGALTPTPTDPVTGSGVTITTTR